MPEIFRQTLTPGLDYTGPGSPAGSIIHMAGDDLLLIIFWDNTTGVYFNLYSVASGGAASWIASAQDTNIFNVIDYTRSDDGKRWLVGGRPGGSNDRRFVFVELDESSITATGFADIVNTDGGWDGRPLFLHVGSDFDTVATDTTPNPNVYNHLVGSVAGVSASFLSTVRDMIVGTPVGPGDQALSRGGANINDTNAFVLLENSYNTDTPPSTLQLDGHFVDSSYSLPNGTMLNTQVGGFPVFSDGDLKCWGGGVTFTIDFTVSTDTFFVATGSIVPVPITGTLGYNTIHGRLVEAIITIVSIDPLDVYLTYQGYDLTSGAPVGPSYTAALASFDPEDYPPAILGANHVMRGNQMIGFTTDGTFGRVDVWGPGGGWYLGSVTF